MRDAHQRAASIHLLHLRVQQPSCDLPLLLSSPHAIDPLPKVRCQRIKIEPESIAHEQWKAAGSQPLPQFVDKHVRGRLGSCAEVQDGNQLTHRIDGDPEPEDLCPAPQARPQFVELEVR